VISSYWFVIVLFKVHHDSNFSLIETINLEAHQKNQYWSVSRYLSSGINWDGSSLEQSFGGNWKTIFLISSWFILFWICKYLWSRWKLTFLSTAVARWSACWKLHPLRIDSQHPSSANGCCWFLQNRQFQLGRIVAINFVGTTFFLYWWWNVELLSSESSLIWKL